MLVVRPRRFLVLAALAALAAALAACGGASAYGGSTNAVAGASVARKGAVVKLRKTTFGKVLVDARGRTLYLYTPDTKNTSACYGQCASFWPPLLSSGKPRAARGLKASLLGTTVRKDGKHQVTYAGHPLYLFANDAKPGQVNGQGVQGVWWVVNAAGRKVTRTAKAATAPATTPTTTTTSDYGKGGGY